jgi:hypothetical protein
MSEVIKNSPVIGDKKDIRTDIEYVKNQLDYLEQYQLKILSKSKGLNSIKVKWNGPKQDESIYKEIDRWVKCYNQLGEHFKVKIIPSQEIKALQGTWSPLSFQKPSTLKEDNIDGFSKYAYKILPFYRIAHNKAKSKHIKLQILNFSKAITVLKSLAFKVESFYMDGV